MVIAQDIQINDLIMRRFVTLINHQRLAHAYMFVGASYSGKGQTARALAKLINCEKADIKKDEKACGNCSSCVKIDSGNHPDVHILESEINETIKINETRDILKHVRLKPFEGKKKILIIRNIETITHEAGNALLKTLEEPTQDSLILLTTSKPERVLPTIKSRCHSMLFSSMSKEDIVDYLIKYFDVKILSKQFARRDDIVI